MEYVSLGSLNSYLKSHVINWKEMCSMAKTAAAGMKEMCSMAKTAAAGIGYLHCETFINGEKLAYCLSICNTLSNSIHYIMLYYYVMLYYYIIILCYVILKGSTSTP